MRRGVRLALVTAGVGISDVQAQKAANPFLAPEPEPAQGGGGGIKNPFAPPPPPAAPGCDPNPCHN
eukprot:COSAG03_NODE_16871_length_390_cov_0.879725_1_plen_65_part_01